MSITFPIGCINWNNNQVQCIFSIERFMPLLLSKGPQMFFPLAVVVTVAVETLLDLAATYPFQRNCFNCTQNHQQCQFDDHCQSQFKCCSKLGLPVIYKLSSQGWCNNLKGNYAITGKLSSLPVLRGRLGSDSLVADDDRMLQMTTGWVVMFCEIQLPQQCWWMIMVLWYWIRVGS